MVSRHRSESPTPTEGPQPSKLGSTPWNSQPSKLGSTPWNAQPSKLGSTPWNAQPSKLGSTKYIQIHRATVELAPPGAGARTLGRSGFNPTALALLRQLVGLKADLQTQLGRLPVVAHQQPSKLGSTSWNSQPSKLGSTPWNSQPSKLGSTPWNSQPGKLGSTRATAADSAERNGILKVPNPS